MQLLAEINKIGRYSVILDRAAGANQELEIAQRHTVCNYSASGIELCCEFLKDANCNDKIF